MIYLDDIIFSLQQHGGVSVLWGNLIETLSATHPDARFIDFRNAMSNKVRSSLQIPGNQLISDTRFPIALERFKSVVINNDAPFAFHSSHYRICNNPNARNLTTLHDFTYEFFFSGIRKKMHIWQKYNAIRKADIVVCISENTRRDLLRFLPDVSPEKIRVVYNGVSDNYYPMEEKNPEYADCLLFVGGRQSYKNFPFAAACAREVGKRLLIVGSPLSDEEKQMLDKNLGKNGYLNIVHPDDSALNSIYNSVCCLIYPSLYEGFGIPVVEAQKAGCPVIAVASSSIPEVTGEGGLLLKQSSTEEFRLKFGQLKSRRGSLIEAGVENARRFSWDKMTSQYIEIYKELLR